jgi:segregation and condensation protein B
VQVKLRSSDQEAKSRIEAALYVSGRPLTPEELARAASIQSKRKAIKLALELMREMNSNTRAIHIVQYPENRFAMQLKSEYAGVARHYSLKPLLPQSALKTLSYIAYFQPVSALGLAEKRGPQAYQHLRTLEQLGFVSGEPSGRTRIYTTTPTFAEYFGLSANPETMKKQLMERGVKV